MGADSTPFATITITATKPRGPAGASRPQALYLLLRKLIEKLAEHGAVLPVPVELADVQLHLFWPAPRTSPAKVSCARLAADFVINALPPEETLCGMVLQSLREACDDGAWVAFDETAAYTSVGSYCDARITLGNTRFYARFVVSPRTA